MQRNDNKYDPVFTFLTHTNYMIYDKHVESVNMAQYKSYSFSHKGHRLHNEDYYITDDHEGIYIITDGMGGYKGGEVASRIAAYSCYEYLKNSRDSMISADDLIDFIRLKLKDVVKTQSAYRFMGTTLCCLYIQEGHLHLVHVGDSKIIIVGDQIYQSSDHTYAQQLVDHQMLHADEYRQHPMRHILTRCISANAREKYKADHQKIPLKNGRNTFFLCSDGVMETFSESTIIQMIREEQDISKIILTLEQSTQKYSKDNSTAIIVGFDFNQITPSMNT